MNPYTKAALFVVRMAGFGLVVIGLILMSSNVILVVTRQPVQQPLALVFEALVLVAGCAVLWKSSSIARSLVRDLEDDDLDE